MYISEPCAACLYDKQKNRLNEESYLREVRKLLDERRETDTAPYMVYRFNLLYEEKFGKGDSYAAIKRTYNDLVLSMEEDVMAKIREAADPLARALAYARVGNYIDFGAMNHVDKDTFLALFQEADLNGRDLPVYESFLKACADAEEFLLIADNCGEIVLDRIFLEILIERFPRLHCTVMVRGSEVLNDATEEDARYAGVDRVASIIQNGTSVAGTIPSMITPEARKAIRKADVILSKGQGNYESLSREGIHIFHAFLCKCDLFTKRYSVPKLTGIFTEEN